MQPESACLCYPNPNDADKIVDPSVLPPPPRYPTQAAYNAAVAAGQAAPMIETNNTLTNPTGPEYQLLVGEGVLSVYSLQPIGQC
jgi:hypothetical protein